MRYIVIVVPLLGIFGSGCGFGQAFTREFATQMADDLGEAVDRKLGDDFKGVGDAVGAAVKALPGAIPKPEKPISPLEEALATAAAVAAAFFARGVMRRYNILGAGIPPAGKTT